MLKRVSVQGYSMIIIKQVLNMSRGVVVEDTGDIRGMESRKTRDLKGMITETMVDTGRVNTMTTGTDMNSISMEFLFLAGFPDSRETISWGKATGPFPKINHPPTLLTHSSLYRV